MDGRGQAQLQAEQDVAIAQALGVPEQVAILRALAAASEPLSPLTLAAQTGQDDTALARSLAVLLALGAIARVDDAGERYRFAQTPLAQTLHTMLAATRSVAAGLQPSSGTLDAILDQMASGAALYNAAGELARLNPAGARITTRIVRPGEAMDERLARYQMRRPDGAPMPQRESPSGRALRGEVVAQMECVIDGQHGPDTWLQCSAAPLKDARGAIQGAVVIFDDITERRRLSQEEARQRMLAEAMIEHTFSGIGLFDVSDAFRCLQHNDNLLRLLDPEARARGTIIGAPLDDLFEGEMRAQVRAIFEQVRATGEPYINIELSAMLTPDSPRRWYRWRLTPLRDDDGKITALLNVAIEITELVDARETSLRFANELSAIIEALPEAVMLADHDGHFVLMNSAVTRILGHSLSLDNPVTRYHEAFHTYSADGRRLEARELPVVRALQGETVVGEEISYERPDGERIDLLTSAAPVDLDATGEITGAVAVFQDITQLRALERQRDDFLGIAAHELRTPLATILATLQAFLRRVQTRAGDQPIEPEALAKGLERMYRQAQRLNALISDLLDSEAARCDLADAAPLPIGQAEHLRDQLARRGVAVATHRANVLVLNVRFARLELLDGHPDALEQVDRLEAGHDDRDLVFGGDRLVLLPPHHGADVSGGEESLHAVVGRVENGQHRGRYGHVRHEHAEIRHVKLRGAPDGHRVGWRGRLEADGEEHHLLVGIPDRQRHRVEWRVHDLDVAAARLDPQQIALAAGHAKHVAERGEDHVGARGEVYGAIDLLERRDADRATGTVNHLDRSFEQRVDSLSHDRVGLSAAQLHERPAA